MVKKRHQPPSRLRYEESHPVISMRVDRELFQRLKDFRASSDKSVADVLREALKVQEPKVKAAFQKGRQQGWDEAKLLYRVAYRCSVCGKPIDLTSDKGKQAAAEFMRRGGWAHAACLEGKR